MPLSLYLANGMPNVKNIISLGPENAVSKS